MIGRVGGDRDEHFGNARVIRNFVEFIQQEQANHLAAVLELSRELMIIEEDDICAAGKDLLSAGKKRSHV